MVLRTQHWLYLHVWDPLQFCLLLDWQPFWIFKKKSCYYRFPGRKGCVLLAPDLTWILKAFVESRFSWHTRFPSKYSWQLFQSPQNNSIESLLEAVLYCCRQSFCCRYLCATIKCWFSVVKKLILRHSLLLRKMRSQITRYQRHSINGRCRVIFNSVLIITTKNRSCSGRLMPGRNNHPYFVVLAVLLKKKLIYKMAISRKRLCCPCLKMMYIQIRTATALGVLCLGNYTLEWNIINLKYGKPPPVAQIQAVGLMQPTVPQKWCLEIPALKFMLLV